MKIRMSWMDIVRGRNRVTIIAQEKKRTHKIFIKSGYQPVAGSYRATPMLSVLQIPYYNVNTLHQILFSF